MSLLQSLLADASTRELPELCRRCRVRTLDLVGSAVAGGFDPDRSDLDFLVAFEAMPVGAYADCYFELLQGLRDLFGREVDLLTDAALENPYLRMGVERGRRRIYGAR